MRQNGQYRQWRQCRQCRQLHIHNDQTVQTVKATIQPDWQWRLTFKMAVLQSLTSLTGFCYRFRESLKAGRNLNIMPSFGLSVLESEKRYSCGNVALLLCPVKLNAYKSQLKYATILLFKRTTISDPTQQQVMMKIHSLLLLLGKPKLVDFSSSHIALLPLQQQCGPPGL